jgi:Tfp pilus assembly protein PilX
MKTAFLRRDRAAALIIVLALIILLTALVVAYFSRAISERQVAGSNASQTKADLLARGALDSIVGDLQQEIAAGSINTTITTGTVSSIIRIPTSPAAAVPALSGTTSGVTFPPNLVKISGTAPFYSGTSYNVSGNTVTVNGTNGATSATTTGTYSAPNRASSASTTGTSANGRTITLARWNKALLLSSTSADLITPTAAFTPPNWILVARSGSNPAVSSYNSNMAYSAANSTTIVGRYAYAIYDEGGLLDMNVAGSPSVVTGTQSGYKGSLAFADLTQVGLNPSQINAIVGWRNYASAQSSGSFPNYNISGSSYYNYILTNTNGFLTVGNQSLSANGQSDRMFSSRQQLIDLVQATSTLGNPATTGSALQYLGTFSRDLEQPSFVPNPARPVVQSGTAGINTSSNSTTFGTGNDAYGLDRYGSTGQPAGGPAADINPPFLDVRVTGTFMRSDGTTAQVGDPLVKKRFPLSRLVWLTSYGPSANNMSNPTVMQEITDLGGNPSNSSDPIYQYVKMGTAPNILASFGLTWTADTVYGGHYWAYNHGNSTGILRLGGTNGVNTLGREADFFELLKAAINVGSLGKASCYSSNTINYYSAGSAGYLQDFRDNQSAVQILQIGANIIDQAKADNYPTRIRFSGDTNTPPLEVRGDEDLPYLYCTRNWIMRIATSGTLGVALLQPELWNPHSYPGSSLLSGSTPTSFRVRLQSDPSSSSIALTGWSLQYHGDSTVVDPTPSSPFDTGTSPTPLTFNAGEPNYWGFREPTLLAQIGVPSSSNLSGTSYMDYPTYTPQPNRQVTGFFMLSFAWTDTSSNLAYKIYPYDNGANSSLRLYLDYQDASGNWITYDDGPVQPYDFGSQSFISMWPQGTAADDLALQEFNVADYYGAARTDPRTSRWGFDIGQSMSSIPMVGGSNSNNEYCTYRPDGGLSYGTHIGGRADKGFANIANNYGSGTGYRGFQHGYWTENSVRQTYQTDSSDSGLRYARDPDGVVRRAMGGYWSDTTNGGTLATSGTSPTTPVVGLPMATGTTNGYISRPTILHRPFRSVAELGYVFSGTPWRNLDLSFPESGDSPLLDVFCVNENTNPTGLVAGRVDSNTRQAPVLQALLSGVILDKDSSAVVSSTLSSTQLANLSSEVVAFTSGTLPVANRSALVGAWTYPGTPATAKTALTTGSDPNVYYTGLSSAIGTVSGVSGTPLSLIPRQRESVMRALADPETSRVWNLMIDVIAQSGRYPPNGQQDLSAGFVVEGEKRYWLHVAIDRYTGQVLDEELEPVTE